MNRRAMKVRFLSAIVFGVALTLSAFSQDANPGQRGGRGGWGGMGGGGGITGRNKGHRRYVLGAITRGAEYW